MSPLHVAFLWHMHQPRYQHPFTGVYILPWVRLHAIKGYTDMVGILDEFPGIRVTFNMVPSLMEQIEDYAAGRAVDKMLDLSRKPARDLTLEEKTTLLANFFMCNFDTMIRKYPGYLDLFWKRGAETGGPEELARVARKFSANDFRDLQVWFNLTWFGYMARKRVEGLSELIEKGRNFTEEEKLFVLDRQILLIKQLVPKYKGLLEEGRIELTCSPFYHPILPLVYDTRIAERTLPQEALPSPFSEPGDAENQIRFGIQFFEKVFGQRPQGMWPSEGSVCPEVIPLFERNGIRWIATDEGIMWESKPPQLSRADVYQPYLAKYRDSQIQMVFRDTFLSDRIGFTYSKNSVPEIEKDFFGHLNSIRNAQKGGKPALLSLILDGENAWEHYPDGGEGFFRMLYGRLEKDPNFRTVRFQDFLKENPPTHVIEKLHSGSWINRNYNIWIGKDEDNQGWDALRRTRRFLTNKGQETPGGDQSETYQKALREIFAAEGSDWFWWYGDDFDTANGDEFDELFRLHLQRVYSLYGEEFPSYLSTPIRKPRAKIKIEMPVHLINPTIDGKITNYFEWLGAGHLLVDNKGTSMFVGDRILSVVYFGFNFTHFFLRMDFRSKEFINSPDGFRFLVDFRVVGSSAPGQGTGSKIGPPEASPGSPARESGEYRIEFELANRLDNPPAYRLSQRTGEGGYEKKKEVASLQIGRIIELSIPFEELKCRQNDRVEFHVEILRGKLNVERIPPNFNIQVAVPDQFFENKMWSV